MGALVREGRVLLAHRRPDKRANPGVWDLPGGHLEADESELDALARELQEELGVQISTASASHLCQVTAGPVGEPVVLSAWLVSDWHGTPTNVAPEEHDDLRWFSLEEMPAFPHVLVRTALLSAMQAHGARPHRPILDVPDHHQRQMANSSGSRSVGLSPRCHGQSHEDAQSEARQGLGNG